MKSKGKSQNQQVVPEQSDVVYDEATMKMLYERRESYRKGLSKSYTAEESINLLRQQKQAKNSK